MTKIFYPSLTYNVDEKAQRTTTITAPLSPIMPELLQGNMEHLQQADFCYPYLEYQQQGRAAADTVRRAAPARRSTITRARDRPGGGRRALPRMPITQRQVRAQGEQALAYARAHGKRIMVLAGRPYHIDPEICHGIDQLAATPGLCRRQRGQRLSPGAAAADVHVLNQWTFHARLYRRGPLRSCTSGRRSWCSWCPSAAASTPSRPTRCAAMLEAGGKYYTQIKIDEITNLGAVKIRLRSLIGALEERA